MQKVLFAALLCFIMAPAFGQAPNKVSVYLHGQYNKTTYDRTAGNNPWGAGLGLQAFLSYSSRLRPTIDFTADAYLEDDKVLRLNPDGTPIDDLGGMVNLFAGASYHPTARVFLSVVAGPSFIGSQTLLGVKPSVGFFLSPGQRCTGKVSFINVFNRDRRTGDDFGSVSLSLGVRLF